MSKYKKDWHKVKDEAELSEELDALDEDLDEDLIDSSQKPKHKVDEGALEHPSYEELERMLTNAEQKSHENWEKAVRATAELENVRRRAEKDVTAAHRYGSEKLIVSLLPVIDSLEQALIHNQDSSGVDAQIIEGLKLTINLFIGVLEKNDVKQIDPQGVIFNPEEHDAMCMQEVDGQAANIVLTVYQKGYKLNGRLIRPARVIVSK